MKYLSSLGFLIAIAIASGQTASAQGLEGYEYGQKTAPDGNEWESPQRLSLNKEQPHAYFFDFADEAQAREVLPYNSSYWMSLNGTWKFHWAPDPSSRPVEFYETTFADEAWDDITVPGCWNVQGIQKDGTLKYGVPVYANQPVIFKHTVAVGDWKGGVMREPDPSWTTYKHRNEVGSYRRSFTVPTEWKGKEIYLNFDGVNSFFYLWINGKYVGFSKNSRTTASFDITGYLVPGENQIAVEVYRNSDGSFLEAQDMWRLPGIFRTVSLNAKNKVQVSDLIVRTTELDKLAATVKVETTLKNLTAKDAKELSLSFAVYACKLWEDDNTPVIGLQDIKAEVGAIKANGEANTSLDIVIRHPKLWNSEEPYRHILVGRLKDKKGNTLETFSTYFGIRKVEIKDTPASEDEFGLAGRYYYINGQPVKLKGVNRQEICLEGGNTITHQQIEDEIMLMRRGNINHVRTSHYANDPYWFYACDKYGIYLEDEANIESHEYYYGEASLSHVPEFKAAHVARVMESVRAHVNAPSIVIWSLGNEAGPGDNFKAAYQAVHDFDPTRPVQYERNNRIVDMGSNQYPSIGWMREAVKGTMDLVYPFHVSEYAHSMGNAVGDLPQYWEAIESTNFFCGGAIWDWVDQALWNYDKKTGTRYMAYGGDFGDKPNSGTFCMNGILYPDHTPKPAFYEVKKVYQYVGVKMLDAQTGKIEVFNKNYFTPTNMQMVWSLWKDGKKVGGDRRDFRPATQGRGMGFGMMMGMGNVGPRQRQQMIIPYQLDSLEKNCRYHVKVQFLLAKDMPWAKAGYVQAEEQFELPVECNYPSIAEVAVAGDNFEVTFDDETGTIATLSYGGKEIITKGNGPLLNTFRAPTDNDCWASNQWIAKGMNNMQPKVVGKPIVTTEKNGTKRVIYSVEYQAPGNDFKLYAQQIWTVYPDGSIELESGITSNEPRTELARVGYAMKLPSSLSNYTYFGRGPKNNYNDRYTGSFVGLYESTVADQFEPFPRPQDMANREDVAWCALTDAEGKGVQFIAADRMSISALPWSDNQLMEAEHPYQLPESDGTYLHLDGKATGLGGNSCGQGAPLDEDRTPATARTFGFIIRPASSDLVASAKVSAASIKPITIERDRLGQLSIKSEQKDAEVVYTIEPLEAKKKTKPAVKSYTEPIDLKEGGKVTAWYKNDKSISATMSFPRVEIVPLTVVYTSSQEPDYGEAENLVDGDPSTVWFTMYSITVAQYPHWVDFDAGEVKSIKGFTYLPIGDGSSGNIKRYRIYLSNDGKEWGEPVVEGEFSKDKSLQRVLFLRPAMGRYIRLTGLDSQNGRDYGGGAEFNILVE